MTSRRNSRTIVASMAVVAIAMGSLGYWFGTQHRADVPTKAAAGPLPAKALYWYDPMVPAQHFDHPGMSPMGMTMIPKLADTGDGADTGVRIDPTAAQDIGVRLATVQRGPLASTVDAAGVLDFNQRNVAIVQARAAGFVQRVYARAPGDVVAAGAPIADILVPSWGGAQAEFLAVQRLGDPTLTSAAHERLVLLGMPEAQIAAVAGGGRQRSVVTVSTPVGGAIQTLDVRQGMTVSAGQTLAQVTSLSSVWLNAAVPEAQTGLVHVGETARVELAAFPGQTFTGRVTILPTAQTDSRTLQVRVELPNPGGRLRPGMFATAHLGGSTQSALLVPSEAVIQTGRRTIVMLAAAKGRYQPVDVRVGREVNGQTEILDGLTEGQQVVASGQFLLDSEASLTGLASRPVAAPATPSPPTKALPLLQTRGRIEAISAGDVTLSHDAVPAIGWPPMTMTFKLASPGLGKDRKVGDRVAFGFEQRDAGPTIIQMTSESPR